MAKAELKGGNLVITIPANPKPIPSKSGKSLIVAGTGGFTATTVQVDGKPLKVSVNAIIDT